MSMPPCPYRQFEVLWKINIIEINAKKKKEAHPIP